MISQGISCKPRTSLYQKAGLIFFGLALCFVTLELGLRLGNVIYRKIYPLPKNSSAQYRIFCMGESTTFGIGASNPSLFSYPRQLEGMLRDEYPGLKIQVFFDYGIGANTMENLIKLPWALEKYKPHLVIFMAGINNWSNLNRDNFLIFKTDPAFSKFLVKTAVFMERFKTYKLLKIIFCNLGLVRFRWSELEKTRYQENTGEYARRVFKDLDPSVFSELTFYDLREMVRICRDNKIKVIICGYPATPSWTEEAQKNVAALVQCPFVDNRAIFEKLQDQESYFSEDNVHPNDKGYRLLAQNVFDCILKNNLIEI